MWLECGVFSTQGVDGNNRLGTGFVGEGRAACEIAMAGLSVDEAREQGIECVSQRLPMKASGRATTINQTDGFVELLADSDTGILLGATIVGPHASELIAEICVAIEMAAAVEDVALTIHPHPTLSELVMDTAQT